MCGHISSSPQEVVRWTLRRHDMSSRVFSGRSSLEKLYMASNLSPCSQRLPLYSTALTGRACRSKDRRRWSTARTRHYAFGLLALAILFLERSRPFDPSWAAVLLWWYSVPDRLASRLAMYDSAQQLSGPVMIFLSRLRDPLFDV